MNKDKIEELQEQEKKLERERIDCLSVDNNRAAKRIEKELYKVRDLIEIEEMGSTLKLKKDLNIYKKFIKNKGMQNEFELFYEKIAKSEEI